MSNSTSDSSIKGTAPIGLINSLAGGGGAAAGAGGHSTLGRKSGMKEILKTNRKNSPIRRSID